LLGLIYYNDFDLKFQSLFFIDQDKNWLISREDMVLKFWFYRLPKYLLATYGVILIILASKLAIYKQNIELQKKFLFLILVLILTPVVVAIFKKYSPIYCPSSVTAFGGNNPHITLFDIFDGDIFLQNTGKCFPAGHASGGFALISLYFVLPNNFKKFGLCFSLLLGWIMGFYQIAKGAHYLSDTIATLALAYLVSISLEQLLLVKKEQ